MQAFDGVDVYPSLEEKAAHLLYFLVKNHSFVDGNKRIGAALFLWFMEKNGMLYRLDGAKRVADNALVAITLMIAESAPDERDPDPHHRRTHQRAQLTWQRQVERDRSSHGLKRQVDGFGCLPMIHIAVSAHACSPSLPAWRGRRRTSAISVIRSTIWRPI